MFCFSGGCCLHESDVMKREVAYCPCLCRDFVVCFSGGCCLHETAKSRRDEKRSTLFLPTCEARTYPNTIARWMPAFFVFVTVHQQGRYRRKTNYRLPSRNYRRIALPPKYYRQILFSLFPSRQLPSDIEIPSTVEKVPSCCITTDVITGTF